MPDSQAQVRYAALVKAGKVKGSAAKKEWASEVLDRMRGRSMDELPVRAAKQTKYPRFGRY